MMRALGKRHSDALGLGDRAALHETALPFTPLPGETVLWQGSPSTSGLAGQVVRMRWAASYFAAFALLGAVQSRLHGASLTATLVSAMPVAVAGLAFLAASYGLALAWSRTTRYFVTTERCVFDYGIALTGTLSLPWRRVARVSLAMQGDGSGDIALAPMRPHRLRFVHLWPHARAWRLSSPEPMLRCVPDAARVGALIREAMTAPAFAAAAPGECNPICAPDHARA